MNKPKPFKTEYEELMDDIEETGEIDPNLGFVE